MYGTIIGILIGLCLLLLGLSAFLIGLVQDYARREKNWYAPVSPIEWDYTKETGWREDYVDADIEPYERKEEHGT